MANRRTSAPKRKRDGTDGTGGRARRLFTERAQGRRSGKPSRNTKSSRGAKASRPAKKPVARPPRNRKSAQPKPKPEVRARAAAAPRTRRVPLRAPREAQAVALFCLGLLSLLSLATYDAADPSINSTGSPDVQNWIGPFGAYWADLLLQTLGIGAFAVALGLLFASWRALIGKRVLPSFRETTGTVLLVVCSGALAHVVLRTFPSSYPAGGVVGAILGDLFLEHFALVGSCILAGALVLVSLALTADGVLVGLGLRGLGALRTVGHGLHAFLVAWRARRERLAERRSEMLEIPGIYRNSWSVGDESQLHLITDEELEVEVEVEDLSEPSVDVSGIFQTSGLFETEGPDETPRSQRIAAAMEWGRQLADEAADEEAEEARRRALRERSEPKIAVDESVDLPAESRMAAGEFETGEFPALDTTPGRPHKGVSAAEAAAEVAVEAEVKAETEVPRPLAPPAPPADATEPNPIRIGAARPESLSRQTEPEPVDDAAAEEGASAKVDAKPKSLFKSKGNKSSEPEIVDVRPEVDLAAIEEAANEKLSDAPARAFELPSPALLDIEATKRAPIDKDKLQENAHKLTKTLKHYGIEGVVREIRPGPVITMYEFVPAPGTKISKIASLADDLAMSMRALRVRIVAPIPGKGAVGIEIPNESVETVFLKELVTHKTYRKTKARLPIALGKDIEGGAYVSDLAKMPHLLVAGATGAGKSVSINAMIMSILYGKTPEEVRMILVDPKMLELSVYEGVPHLLLPVVTDPKKAAVALRWAVCEMEKRYKYLSALGVRNIDGFNVKVDAAAEAGEPLSVDIKDAVGNVEKKPCEHMPYIVIIVDELADLMMVASREVESSIMRLAQMARAAGIHLILATQRPSVDVLTGVIKANFPTRIAFQVASKHDSRTILDGVGAEHLLGRGDMLFLSPGAGGVSRVHGAYVSEPEIERTVAFVKQQGDPEYDESILAADGDIADAVVEDEEVDEMYVQAVAIVTETRQASISMIQRRLRIGYNRAARLVETMEREGIVGPADGPKPREVLAPPA